MKILFPFVGDSVGGSHISTLDLYSSLINKNITAIIVLHKDKGPLSEYLRNKNIPFYVLRSSKLAGEIPSKLSIITGVITNFFIFSKFIKTHKIDIVHGNDLRINLSWSLPAKAFAKGFVWHQRTILTNSRLWLFIRYLCDYFVAISNTVMQNTPKNIKNYKKKIIHNPFNIDSPPIDKKLEREFIVKKYNLPQDCFLLGCVGRIVKYKNIDFVIKNIANIYRNTNKNVYLIIVGTGADEYINELKKYINELRLNDNIIFEGFSNNPNKIIASVDLLVAPSTIDAFGRTIVESMLQKTLVLAAKSGGHKDIINNNINGIFYNPNIKNDFINKVVAIINNKNVNVNVNVNALSNEAYQFAQDNFSSEQHLNSMLSIYNNIFIQNKLSIFKKNT